ncbi:phospholipid/cholesterol/gamma-HCH transport system substrate-binding protein [Gillisia sp. Hel1_33_143]|uniref:MlaD family protein n=1 Tax=Gillisia sp. Hel1_33_143 TaxID=1336796 RepID=UPI00087B1CEE|nr:MlaD family protein [Gillisia sp. Hel1_33_143]SDS77616.1 phospholipid/cholesterol/gamma-HCH transport system substrate-binding protein [Gillisia sp. Hel1_33_143]
MEKGENKNLLLGVFVTVAILIFVLAIYFIGSRQNMFGNTSDVSSIFKNVNGLQIGNNVRFSGVNVGTVKGITILNDTSICVDMKVDNSAMKLIRSNAQATISSDGLVGSMIVNIVPVDNYINEPLRNGDTIASISKIATADMLTTLNTTNENAALLTADLLKISNAINNGEGTIGALLKSEELAENFENSISNFEQAGKLALRTISNLNATISKFDMDNSAAGKIFNDTITAGKIDSIMQNIETSSVQIKQISMHLNAFSNKLNSEEGAFNSILTDTIIASNVEQTLKNVESASEKFDENMEALKHNFLFKGYFKKLERKKARALKKNESE